MWIYSGHHETFKRSSTDVHFDRFWLEGENVHTVVAVPGGDHIVGRLFEATVGAWWNSRLTIRQTIRLVARVNLDDAYLGAWA